MMRQQLQPRAPLPPLCPSGREGGSAPPSPSRPPRHPRPQARRRRRPRCRLQGGNQAGTVAQRKVQTGEAGQWRVAGRWQPICRRHPPCPAQLLHPSCSTQTPSHPPSAAAAPRSSSSPQPAPTSPMSNSSMAAAAAAAAAPGAPLARSESAAQPGGTTEHPIFEMGCTVEGLQAGTGYKAFGLSCGRRGTCQGPGSCRLKAHPPFVASCSKKPLLTVSRGQLSSRMIGVGGVSRRPAGVADRQGRRGGGDGEAS
jgi:hypothetical protein